MRLMKSRILTQAVVAAFMFSALVSAVQAEEMDMKNLEVKLGFTRIPDECTCHGSDASPEIAIQGLNATSMAVIVDDPDAASGSFTHWIIWNIPPMGVIPGAIPKNATVNKPISALQGMNSFGEVGYGGPCPPPGKPHRYFFRVFGLDRMLDLRPGASRSDLEKAMVGHVLQKGEAMATYGR
jgi:Raf kinase inhibitor-like YbhB/YbcL family protein